MYESESKELEEWADSPGEVCVDDWRGYLGRREYQRAYLDFFEDEVVRCGYDWKKVVEEYLFDSKTPLVNSLISGCELKQLLFAATPLLTAVPDGHPLIHLGYAYEMDNREIAMEALAMTASCYSDIHKYFDDAFYFRNASEPGFSMTSLTGILERVQDDESFKGQLKTESDTNLDTVFRTLEAPLLKHWAAWEIVNATAQFEDAQRLATALLVNSGTDSHDFFVAHLVTTTHALRVIFPEIPAQHHVTLLRQWWLLCLAVYIAESHPRFGAFSIDEIKDYDLKGRDWNWVSRCAVQNELSTSAHYIKPLRTMRDAEKTWGDKGGFYLRAAVKFIDEFKGWSGL